MRTSLRQFSLRMLLLLAAACAIGIALWKTFIRKPPTHTIASYEQAPAFYGTTASIGPNRIRIASVARNDRDGSVTIENGRGKSSDETIPYRDWLIDSAKWLDVVQIDLRPDGELLDIIEVRIFDHASREIIATAHSLTGWRVVEPNVIQIYGLGIEIPRKLDVWMRVHSYAADDPILRLPPSEGSSVSVNGRVLTMNAIQRGFKGWSSSDGFYPVEGTHHADCAIELGWEGTSNIGRYQIAAVSNQGEKHFEDLFLTFSGIDGRTVVNFNLPLDSIRHFEVRPFGGRHRLFFDGIELPKTKPTTQTSAFADPPKVTLDVGGDEIAQSIPQFLPLDVGISIHDGDVWSGSTSSGTHASLIPRADGPTDVGVYSNLVLNTRGLNDFPYRLRFRLSGSQTWTPDSAMTYGGMSASGAGRDLIGRRYRTPIVDMDEVELSLKY